MAWDDEDFEIPTNNKGPTSWEDEEDDDDPVLDSWDVDPEEEANKQKKLKQEEEAKKLQLKKQQEEAKRKKQEKNDEFDQLDELSKKELLKKAELNADLNNAADLFGGLGVAEDEEDFDINQHPRERAAQAKKNEAAAIRRAPLTIDTPLEEHPLFQPTNKSEYERLRKTLGTTLTQLNEDSSLLYASSLAIDLIRDLTQPLSVENLRKVISTLNVVIKDKERQERMNRLKKAGGTATGGAGKKKAKPAAKPNVGGFKKDAFDDMDDGFDDLDDDDFM